MDLESRRPDVVRGVQMRRAGRGRPDGPEVGELAFQAFDLELQRAAAGEDEGHPAGRGVRPLELDGEQIEHPVLVGRLDVARLERIDALEAQRREPPLCAFSQSKRLTTTTTRFSAGRHRMSPTLTMESCTCVETTARSSVSSATSFSISMARPEFPRIAFPVAAPPIWGGPHGSAMLDRKIPERKRVVCRPCVSPASPRPAPAAARARAAG